MGSNFKIKSKSSLYRGITPKRATSGGAHLHGLAPGQHSSEAASQGWRAVATVRLATELTGQLGSNLTLLKAQHLNKS